MKLGQLVKHRGGGICSRLVRRIEDPRVAIADLSRRGIRSARWQSTQRRVDRALDDAFGGIGCTAAASRLALLQAAHLVHDIEARLERGQRVYFASAPCRWQRAAAGAKGGGAKGRMVFGV